MAVPKIAVIALVAIVAAPILMGFAFNLNETTVKAYESNKDPVNVTQLLQTGTDWSIAKADPYYMNSYVSAVNPYESDHYSYSPVYESVGTLVTTMPIRTGDYNYYNGINFKLEDFSYYEVIFDYIVSASDHVEVKLTASDNTVLYTYDRVTYVKYVEDEGKIYIKGYYNSTFSYNSYAVDVSSNHVYKFVYSVYGLSNSVPMHYWVLDNPLRDTYADVSGGYHFEQYSNLPGTLGWTLELPENSYEAVLTIDLDSITESSYEVKLEMTNISLIKTTTDGVVNWKLRHNGSPYEEYDLYYDPAISNNTYQLIFTDYNRMEQYNSSLYDHFGHVEARYIGNWTKTFGLANYYQSYGFDYYYRGSQNYNLLDGIDLRTPGYTHTPRIRIDSVSYRGFEYPILQDKVYDPAAFKTNPATTIANIQSYGDNIEFGGHSYDVIDGNITINSHKIPINNMIFDSIPNEDNTGYDNRINGTVVSTTADPSTITFNGRWSANISTVSMGEITRTVTEWEPGKFAWNGIDDNFLIVGMITSLGAFIALGLYARRSRSGLWPLVLVCGGAAMMFFLML